MKVLIKCKKKMTQVRDLGHLFYNQEHNLKEKNTFRSPISMLNLL